MLTVTWCLCLRRASCTYNWGQVDTQHIVSSGTTGSRFQCLPASSFLLLSTWSGSSDMPLCSGLSPGDQPAPREKQLLPSLTCSKMKWPTRWANFRPRGIHQYSETYFIVKTLTGGPGRVLPASMEQRPGRPPTILQCTEELRGARTLFITGGGAGEMVK